MIAIYLAACTKATEHNIGKKLAEYAALDAFGIRCTLIHDERGKPSFSSSDPANRIFVSISHSHELCLAAVSDSVIGADIEYMEGRGDKLMRLAQRFFSADELDYVSGDPSRRFYEIWTAKESFIKYTGEGFSRPMPSFSVLENTLKFTHFMHGDYAVSICSEQSANTEMLRMIEF